jgi:hypothetical protein
MIRWPSAPVPKWVRKRMDELFIEGLFYAQMAGKLDEATDNHVRWVLLSLRWQRAIYPYLQIFKLMWEIIRGKYWRAAKKIHSGSNQTSSTGPGAGGVPVAQFTSHSGGFAFAGAPINPNPNFAAAGSGVSQSLPVASVFEDSGIKAGEVTGYRCWLIDPSDGLLHSCVYTDYVWKPGEIAEGTPGDDPHAGIYAYKSVLDLHNYGSPDAMHVSGTIDMWGEVYEHLRGYRAQYAAIASIDESPHYDAAKLRELYGLNKKKRKKK